MLGQLTNYYRLNLAAKEVPKIHLTFSQLWLRQLRPVISGIVAGWSRPIHTEELFSFHNNFCCADVPLKEHLVCSNCPVLIIID